ncbi:MAG: glycosyltransferase family 2 protein [Bacillota bacterium]
MKHDAFVSFIIPTYQDDSLLKKCLDSLVSKGISGFAGKYEVIIVDDGSSPEIQKAVIVLAKMYGCKVILKSRNESFTRAVNSGLKIARGNYLVLVNNDIEFCQKGWLLKILSLFQADPKVGIAGCRLVYPDGTIQHGGMGYYPNGKYMFAHYYHGYPRNHPAAMENRIVLAVTGALMTIKRALLQDIGLLDETFLLVCSDTDICLRTHKAGWAVAYCGQAEAIHHEGGTRGNTAENKIPAFSVLEDKDVEVFFERWHKVLPKMAEQIHN